MEKMLYNPKPLINWANNLKCQTIEGLGRIVPLFEPPWNLVALSLRRDSFF